MLLDGILNRRKWIQTTDQKVISLNPDMEGIRANVGTELID